MEFLPPPDQAPIHRRRDLAKTAPGGLGGTGTPGAKSGALAPTGANDASGAKGSMGALVPARGGGLAMTPAVDSTRARERWEPPPVYRPAWREEMTFSLGLAGLLLILGIGLMVEIVPVPVHHEVVVAAATPVIWGIPPEASIQCTLGARDGMDECPKGNMLVRVPLHNSMDHPIQVKAATAVASQPLVFELLDDGCSNTTLDAGGTCMINYVIHADNVNLPGTYTFSMVVPGLVGQAGTRLDVVP